MNATRRVRGSEGRPQLLGGNNLLDDQSLLIQIIQIISYLNKRIANILCCYPMIILLLKYCRKTCFVIVCFHLEKLEHNVLFIQWKKQTIQNNLKKQLPPCALHSLRAFRCVSGLSPPACSLYTRWATIPFSFLNCTNSLTHSLALQGKIIFIFLSSERILSSTALFSAITTMYLYFFQQEGYSQIKLILFSL